MSPSLTILHLSDLQFGRHHRYPEGDESYQSLYAKLADNLDDLAKRHDVRPAAIVITGDVAEMSVPAEYDAAERFLGRLGTHLGVPRQRVIVVPTASMPAPNSCLTKSTCSRSFPSRNSACWSWASIPVSMNRSSRTITTAGSAWTRRGAPCSGVTRSTRIKPDCGSPPCITT